MTSHSYKNQIQFNPFSKISLGKKIKDKFNILFWTVKILMIQTQSVYRSVPGEESRCVSQFTVNPKGTPTTALPASNTPKKTTSPCQFCSEHLSALTRLRKNEILLELELQQRKAELSVLQKQNEQLKSTIMLTYKDYQSKLQLENHDYWNRQDIEAELFEAKMIIELLLVSKSSHPQIKLITDQGLKNKYTQVLLQNLRLQEKVEARDRVIAEKQFFPVFHGEKRMNTLKKVMEHWYRKANEDCARMKGKVIEMRTRLEEEKNELRQEMKNGMETIKNEILKTLDLFTKTEISEKQFQPQKKIQKMTVSMVSAPEKKKMPNPKSSELKKFR